MADNEQTQWGPSTPGELLNDAYKGREAKRWLDSANAANEKQKEVRIAEENRIKREEYDAKWFKGPWKWTQDQKDQVLGTGKYFKNSFEFSIPATRVMQWRKEQVKKN